MVRMTNGMALLALALVTACHAAPAFEQRTLWTWDHRMDWGGGPPGGTVMGGGTYRKTAEEFLADYRALLDYMHEHTCFNAVIIWGFLRDAHGGVEAARELCEVANARGIRIIPGVGTSGYEGYYFQGNHPYNVTTWLREHPQLRAIAKDGRPHNALCPTKLQNVQWLQDGCRWLFESFPIGGINFEIGDFFVCHCPDCRRARERIPGDAPDYYKDMALSTAPVAKLARELSPDAWLSYATYTGFTPEMVVMRPAWVDLVPEEIACQWTLTSMVSDVKWPPGLVPPTARNTGYLHWGNKSTHSVHHFFLRGIQDVCRRASEAGFLGLTTYGEDPASLLTMRLFYHSWSYFLESPGSTLDDYAAGPLAEWFDSAEDAGRMVRIALALEDGGLTRQSVTAALEQAREAQEASPGEKARAQWGELVAFLQDRLAELQAEDRVLVQPDAVAAAMREGFRVPQQATVEIVLPQQPASVLELLVRVDYAAENGLLPVMRLSLNGTPLGPEQAPERPARIETPDHGGYASLPAYDVDRAAWRVKYDPDFEVDEPPGEKYHTRGYSSLFRFQVEGLWREGENRLRIENLEHRFRPGPHGVLAVGRLGLQ